MDAVDAGEIGSGHAVTALYEVVLRDNPTSTLATLRIRAKKPGPDAPAQEWSTPLRADARQLEFASASAAFRLATGVATFAELLRGSHYTEEVGYGDVAKIIREATGVDDTRREELLGLVHRADDLTGASVVSAE